MTDTLATIAIPMEPVPKGRPRRGRGNSVYTPPETRQATEDVSKWVRAAWKRDPLPLDARVCVRLTFYVRRQRGDIDNYCKLILDACNSIVWTDDRQVIELHAVLNVDLDARGYTMMQVDAR